MTPPRTRRARATPTQSTGKLERLLDRRAGRVSETDAPFVAQYFGDDSDTPTIEMLKSSPPTTQSFRGKPGGHLHVSDVIGKCLRKIILMERLGQRHPQEKIMDGRGVTFAIGDALGAFVTRRIAAGHGDKLWANWKCRCGETSWKGLLQKARTFTCEVCDTPLEQHNEVAFRDDEWTLTGSPDLILYMDQYGAYYITELKSISGEQWKELVRPIPDHVIQVTFYWHLLHRAGWPLVNRCGVLYTNKEFSFKSPYKEFMVDPMQGRLEPYLKDLQAFKEGREGGDLPARTMCASIDSASTKACPVAVTCFGCDK